jgi:hypothetical protein
MSQQPPSEPPPGWQPPQPPYGPPPGQPPAHPPYGQPPGGPPQYPPWQGQAPGNPPPNGPPGWTPPYGQLPPQFRPPPQRPHMPKKKRLPVIAWIGLGFAGLFVFFLIIGIIASVADGGKKATATPRVNTAVAAVNATPTAIASAASASATPGTAATVSDVASAPTLAATAKPAPTEKPTATPKPTATSKPTITPKPPTSTPVPPTATYTAAQYDDQYPVVDIREVDKNPDSFKGRQFRFTGEIFNINESAQGTQLQIWVQTPGGSDLDRVAVIGAYPGSMPGVLKGQTGTFYVVGAGHADITNAFNAKISQPLVVIVMGK